jgi:5-formyltetrahydrofolate cyclo-ligase
MSIKSQKRALRDTILNDFETINPRDRSTWSEMIASTLMSLPELASAPGPLMAFLSMGDELDTGPLIRRLLEAGYELYTPRTLLRQRALLPRRLRSLDDVVVGAYDIREPASEESLEPEKLGFVVVPAVAFDRSGARIGRGGGFYDRFLERLQPSAVTCGVILSRHLLDEVPTEPHDKRVQLLVTEEGVHRFR